MTRPASNGSIIGATQDPTPTSAGGIWTLPAQLELQKQGKWIAPGYNISRSLRFDSARSNYLSRTPGSAGNRKTFTFSCWVKRVGTGTDYLFLARNGTGSVGSFVFGFRSDAIRILSDTAAGTVELIADTVAVFRDYSAWYHVMFYVDTSQATDANKVKIYVNGVEQDLTGVTYPSTNSDLAVINTTIPHYIGRNEFFGGTSYEDYYLAEVHFVDGQALDPSYFGVVDNLTGVWRPKQVEDMTYGTNGFYLPFSDNTSTTTLGYDQSGNSNNWTLSAGFSVASGANNDSMVDVPTGYGTDTGAGGEVRGNYCTLNPLVGLSGNRAFSNGNLQVAVTTNNVNTFGTFQIPSSGKWFFEYQITTITAFPMGGLTSENRADVSSSTVVYRTNGDKLIDGTTSAYGATYTTTDIIGVGVDADGGSVTFYKNGSSQGAISYSVAGLFPVFRSNSQPDTFVVNFGQRPWAYAAPAGFKALCTTNLPDPTVVQGDDYFNTVLYTGNETGQSITGVGFQPDFVWFKARNGALSNFLVDAVRGNTKYLVSNTTDAETTNTNRLTSFDSDGFTVGDAGGSINGPYNIVAWNWKANGAGVSNTAGDIPSTVSANQTAGISIVTYTGTGSLGTVGHGLGVKPSFILTKSRSTTEGWGGYHKSLGASYGIFLELTDAAYAASNYWNNTEPTSTVFTVNVNRTNNGTMVAYCFAEVEGFSKFGSYTGNASTDGPFVYTGFRPAYVMMKSSSEVQEWVVFDNKRPDYNATNLRLNPNNNGAEAGTQPIDILANGFKVRGIAGNINTSGGTYIFACFASNPFKTSLAR